MDLYMSLKTSAMSSNKLRVDTFARCCVIALYTTKTAVFGVSLAGAVDSQHMLLNNLLRNGRF